ncbi:MAG: mechanosensitive ion channel domain-containing protein [Planctomycetota bacterium]
MHRLVACLIVFLGCVAKPDSSFGQFTLPDASQEPAETKDRDPTGAQGEKEDGDETPDSLAVADPVVSQKLTLESIAAKLAAVKTDASLTDEQQAALAEQLDKAKLSLERADAYQQASERNERIVTSAPRRQTELQLQLDSIGEEPPFTIDANASATELNAQLVALQAELDAATKQAEALAAEPARRRTRSAEIPETLAATEDELDNLKPSDNTPPNPADESDLSSSVIRMARKARISELSALIKSLQSEQATYTATGDLVAIERKLADAQVRSLRAKVKSLNEAIELQQREEAEEMTEDLRETIRKVPENLRASAQGNIDLAESNQLLIDEAAATKRKIEEIREARLEVESNLTKSQDRVETVGLTEALGYILRSQRDEAEQLRYRFRPKSDVSQRIRDHQIATFKLEDDLRKVRKQLDRMTEPNVDWESTEIDWEALGETDSSWVLLRNRMKLIEEKQQSQDLVLQTLLDSDVQRSELLKSIDEYTTFIDQRLFWTRSAPVVSIGELTAIPAALRWVIDPENWRRVWLRISMAVSLRTAPSLLLTVSVGLLLYLRPRLRDVIVREGEAASKLNVQFRSTSIALLATIADACVWPAVLMVPGYLLSSGGNGDAFVRGLSAACLLAALYVAPRELLRQLCRPRGLAQAHFGWSDELRKHLRRHLRWYTLSGGVCIFLLAGFHEHPESSVRLVVWRITAMVLFVLTAMFHHLMLNSKSPIYLQLVRNNPESRTYRLRKLIWAAGVLLPSVFGLMALTGYLETIFRMARSIQSSFLLLVAVVILYGLISRWMMLRKRDFARAKAAEMRAKRSGEEPAGNAALAAKEAGIVVQEEETFDLRSLDERARQTANIATWLIVIFGGLLIWSDLLPAVTFLDGIDWAFGQGEEAVRVSLLDVLCAMVSVVAVFYATRVIPGMLDLLVLGQTKLDSGARYAISTLLRYAIIVIGTLIVLNLLSIPYNQLGWLLAAISVGLGFGLQEIVANFVSGIILLLERPVRVGDVVTIDGTTGIVSRIQIRATTVTNWDRKELVIPNKDLITEKLLNWSLSSVINRLTISIGVAYGTDPDQVRGILHRIVTSHSEVMKDPSPLINFDTFGDSSLNFMIRFYLPTLDKRLEVTHQINTEIAKEFEKAGIEIPFPQRDVNLKVDKNIRFTKEET